MNEVDAVSRAEQRLTDGDVDGFLDLFGEEAKFCLPGSTRISGDHDRDGFRTTLELICSAIKSGAYKPELICRYRGDDGVISVFDNHVAIDGQSAKYHSVHEWILRDGRPTVLLLYVHEYDLYEAAWR